MRGCSWALTSWRGVGLATIVLLGAAGSAAAVDLTVQSLEINQGVQFGSTQLIAGKTTMVRAKVAISGVTGGAIADVDAVLRVFVNGVELPGSPIFSINGPIAAPQTPAMLALNDTINFCLISPVSNDVDFVVEVNPTQALVETSFANNTLAVDNKVFLCRDTVEMIYVPIFYVPFGAAPDPALLEPGIGDGFIRAIYSPGEWNYHRSPLPPLQWTQFIGSSSNSLLNTLSDIRTNQIPSAGYPQAPFLFGWLPGNPYSGNGKAISIPGDVAFGNTEVGRHQRTFAHELGHLVGLVHNSQFINTVGVDTEHHLWDTEDLAQTFGPEKRDIMVAGLLTFEAFVAQNSYNTFINDARVQCPDFALAPPAELEPMLRVSGIITLATRAIEFDDVTRIERGQSAVNDPRGDLLVVALDAAGAPLYEVGYLTGTTSQTCGGGEIDPQSPFHLLIPESAGGKIVDAIQLVDRASGKVLAQRHRSPQPPSVMFTSITANRNELIKKGRFPQDGQFDDGAAALNGPIHLEWSGADPDGDSLRYTILYSPDGEAWLPLAVNLVNSSFDFQSTDVPASGMLQGRFRISVTDGMNHGETTTEALTLGPGSPPDVYLLSPNTGTTHRQHAPIALHAAAWDMEDLMLEDEDIHWTSSLDGKIGDGNLFIINDLSPGDHTITVTGIDLDGRSASKQIAITVTPREIVNPDLNGDGQVSGLDLAMLLGEWGPCPGVCPADLNFDDQVTGLDLALLLGSWG